MKQPENNAKLKFKILLLRGKLFYMKYLKIAVWALIEIIAELYNNKRDRR
jgi:hypothetical protein